MLQLNLPQGELVGPSGTLPVSTHDEVTCKLAMLIAGECLGLGPQEAAHLFGYSKQRYFQLRDAFADQGAAALVNQTPGPGRTYRCTEEAVRQAVRHRFLDPRSFGRGHCPKAHPGWPAHQYAQRRTGYRALRVTKKNSIVASPIPRPMCPWL